MSIVLSVTALEKIHQMPLREKLLVLEAIWDDISREEKNLEVPQWHKDILDERERMVARVFCFELIFHDSSAKA